MSYACSTRVELFCRSSPAVHVFDLSTVVEDIPHFLVDPLCRPLVLSVHPYGFSFFSLFSCQTNSPLVTDMRPRASPPFCTLTQHRRFFSREPLFPFNTHALSRLIVDCSCSASFGRPFPLSFTGVPSFPVVGPVYWVAQFFPINATYLRCTGRIVFPRCRKLFCYVPLISF